MLTYVDKLLFFDYVLVWLRAFYMLPFPSQGTNCAQMLFDQDIMSILTINGLPKHLFNTHIRHKYSKIWYWGLSVYVLAYFFKYIGGLAE